MATLAIKSPKFCIFIQPFNFLFLHVILAMFYSFFYGGEILAFFALRINLTLLTTLAGFTGSLHCLVTDLWVGGG